MGLSRSATGAGSITLAPDGAQSGTRVLVMASDRDVRVITEDDELLRKLTLDPSRDYQARS
jgi:hypothetical protein